MLLDSRITLDKLSNVSLDDLFDALPENDDSVFLFPLQSYLHFFIVPRRNGQASKDNAGRRC